MVFSSPRFLLFLAGLLLVLGLLGSKDVKKRLLTAASCLFYAAWDWRYLGLLLGISVIDWIAAARMSGTDSALARRRWLLVSLVSNLGVLAVFKYCNFFIETANVLLASVGIHLKALDILLPAGISFYTFKTMSYTIDVYRRQLKPCRSWVDYAMFVTFFPDLIAGPIVRASVFLPQMDRDPGPTSDRLVLGAGIFLQGLTKKLFIADRLASIADPVFRSPSAWSTGNVWFGVIAYSFQIYCDFSGYSDMAVGTAKMIGYDLPENFRMPYSSFTVTEFWRRWHVTLSTWLRDYIYIPLGGNRRGEAATYRNLMLTMLLGGLWHGASWNFVIWGGIHGAALAVHKYWKRWGLRIPGLPSWILTQLVVLLSWVPFRAATFHDTATILRRMFRPSHGAVWSPAWLFVCASIIVLAHIVGRSVEKAVKTGECPRWLAGANRWLGFRISTDPLSGPYLAICGLRPAGAYLLTLWLLTLFLLSPTRTSPFIYFQF